MSASNDTVQMTHSQADLDAARDAGTKAGLVQGAAAERTRIQTILSSDEAKGREKSAQHLAFNTDLSAEIALATLAGLEPAAAAAPAAPVASLANRANLVEASTETAPQAPKAAVIDTNSIYAARAKAQGRH